MSEGNTPQDKDAVAAVSPPPQDQALVRLESRVPAPPSGSPPSGPGRRRGRRFAIGILLLVIAPAGAGGGWYWWQQQRAMALPPGFASGNGRIEAEQVDIATKTPGRLAEVLVEEGAMVRAGQVLGRMDTREAEAALRRAQAQLGLTQRMLEARQATAQQQRSQLTLAEAELERARSLFESGYGTRQALDQRIGAWDAAAAALSAAMAQIGEAEQAIRAAAEEVERLQVQLADSVLTAPIDGRVQYRLANPGEVLGAGGRVLTLLDVTNVYMAVFLPTQEAGRVAIGAEGRIVLDALSNYVIPAHVSFLSPQAQFTPKAVETRSERERLMFRVKLRIEPDLLRTYAEQVRTGLPGTGYVRLDPAVAWPARLQPGRRVS